MSRGDDSLWHLHDEGRALVAAGTPIQPLADRREALRALVRAWTDAGAPIGEPLAAEAQAVPFTIPVGWVEGEPTGDGRTINPDAVKWRNPPLPFLLLDHTDLGGHIGAVVCGRIDTLSTSDDPDVAGQKIGTGSGVYSNDPVGERAHQLALTGAARGVSIDLTAMQSEYVWPDPPEGIDEDELWLWEMMTYPDLVITYAEIGAITQCPIPAFARAYVQVDGATFDAPGRPAGAPEDADDWAEPLTAAAGQSALESLRLVREQEVFYMTTPLPPQVARLRGLTAAATATAEAPHPTPLRPPADWFAAPDLPGPTPLTITDTGRVFGHAATWDVAHIGLPGQNRHAPRSSTHYAWFRTGNVLTAEGELLASGPLTIGAGHADLTLSAREARAHYDNSATAFADVVAGEDEHGIWVAGYIRPGTTHAQVAAARASSLSGDWRPVDLDGDGRDDTIEAVAFLCVNTPGFPQVRALAADGQLLALVAAGSMTLARLRRDQVAESDLAAAVEAAVAPMRDRMSLLETAARPALVASIRERVAPRP